MQVVLHIINLFRTAAFSIKLLLKKRYLFKKLLFQKSSLRKKYPNMEFFLVRVFPYSDWIWIFALYTDICSVNLRIQSEYGKIWTRKNSAFGCFPHSGYFLETANFSEKQYSAVFFCFFFQESYFCIALFCIVLLLHRSYFFTTYFFKRDTFSLLLVLSTTKIFIHKFVINTAWKVSVFGFILVQMRDNTDQNNCE